MPTAREVPDTGTRASDLSDGSKGIPRIPSCTEYRRKEPTPTENKCKFWPFKKFVQHHSYYFNQFLLSKFGSIKNIYMHICAIPSQDCCPLRRLYPAVHMQALVDGEVGRHSWEQSPLLLLQRLEPGNTKCMTINTQKKWKADLWQVTQHFW